MLTINQEIHLALKRVCICNGCVCYGMSEVIEAEIAYKCDVCGELFNSPDDAQDHSQNAHAKSGLTDDSDRGL